MFRQLFAPQNVFQHNLQNSKPAIFLPLFVFARMQLIFLPFSVMIFPLHSYYFAKMHEQTYLPNC